MQDIKNIATTIAGVLGALGVAIGTVAAQGIALPEWLLVVAGACTALSVAILGFFSGKNADGSSKTPAQLAEQKNGK
jgi:hypothetical protein